MVLIISQIETYKSHAPKYLPGPTNSVVHARKLLLDCLKHNGQQFRVHSKILAVILIFQVDTQHTLELILIPK